MAADPHSIDALQIVINAVQNLRDVNFISATYHGDAFGLTNRDGRAITFTKLGLTKTTDEAIGYTVDIYKGRGQFVKYTLWVMEPFRGNMIEYNRQALLAGLQMIIGDPNVGKQTFEIWAKQVARDISRRRA